MSLIVVFPCDATNDIVLTVVRIAGNITDGVIKDITYLKSFQGMLQVALF